MKFIPVLICLAVVLMAPVSFGKTEVHGPAVPATVLDHNEFPCDNCLFGMADYYACFDVGGKTLIGHEKVRTQTRKHAPVEIMQRGQNLQLSFNDKYIWIPQPKGKDLRLTQDYTKKIFLDSDRCQAAVK